MIRSEFDHHQREYLNHKKNVIDWDNMEKFDTALGQMRLLLKEMLYINKLKPQLNAQKSSKFSLIIANNENKGRLNT